MLGDKIKIYESLLDEISSLEKECFQIEIEMVREFGEEINNIFSLKIEAITLKKKITYCIKKQNKGEDIDFEKMENHINALMAEKRKELNEMIEYKKAVDSNKIKVNFDEKREIKSIYYRIVHLIHPDLHPELEKKKKIKELWQESVDAYKRNDIKTLRRAYDQILIIVDINPEIVLDNIDVKISIIENEINEIKESNQYKSKFILSNQDELEALHEKYHKEEKYYMDYIKELSIELSKLFLKKECDA